MGTPYWIRVEPVILIHTGARKTISQCCLHHYNIQVLSESSINMATLDVTGFLLVSGLSVDVEFLVCS